MARIHVLQAALAALLALAPVVACAAIFDDGNDRHYVKELRAKDPASLTAEEKANQAVYKQSHIMSQTDVGRYGAAIIFRAARRSVART